MPCCIALPRRPSVPKLIKYDGRPRLVEKVHHWCGEAPERGASADDTKCRMLEECNKLNGSNRALQHRQARAAWKQSPECKCPGCTHKACTQRPDGCFLAISCPRKSRLLSEKRPALLSHTMDLIQSHLFSAPLSPACVDPHPSLLPSCCKPMVPRCTLLLTRTAM